MKFGITFLTVILGFGVQAWAGSLGIERTFLCTSEQAALIQEVNLVYTSTVYSQHDINVSRKSQLPFKVKWGDDAVVLGLDLREVINSKSSAEDGSSIEVSAAADEMTKDAAKIVVRVRLYKSGLLNESISTMSCKLVEHKDLNFN